MKRIGVLGGAFDPPHLAHVAMAQAALQQLKLNELQIFPTGQAWHKAQALSPASDRLALCKLAFAGMAKVVVNPAELQRSGPTYTVETLRAMALEHPQAQLFLIIGQDQARALPSWYQIDEIVQKAIIWIVERDVGPGNATKSLSGNPDTEPQGLVIPTQTLKLPRLAHSATEVRDLVAKGLSIDALVPQDVARYIHTHHLYQPAR